MQTLQPDCLTITALLPSPVCLRSACVQYPVAYLDLALVGHLPPGGADLRQVLQEKLQRLDTVVLEGLCTTQDKFLISQPLFLVSRGGGSTG
jgi:hypothetical protein